MAQVTDWDMPARDRLHKFAVEDTNTLDRIAAAIV